jgi:hypothetical protein
MIFLIIFRDTGRAITSLLCIIFSEKILINGILLDYHFKKIFCESKKCNRNSAIKTVSINILYTLE